MRCFGYFMLFSFMLLSHGIIAATPGWVQKEFILMPWSAPPSSDKNLNALASEGYNLIMLNCYKKDFAPAAALDKLQKYGLKALIVHPLLLDSTVLKEPAKTAALIKLINQVKTHPAFVGYFLSDEPRAGAFPALQQLSDFIRAHDRTHLVYINLLPIYATKDQLEVFMNSPQPKIIPNDFTSVRPVLERILNYQEHLRLYVKTIRPELLSYDHYHFWADGLDQQFYFLNLDLIRTSALNAGIPFLNIVQASQYEQYWRPLTASELRWLAYTTMAYGGRGICWFHYWGSQKWPGLYCDDRKTPQADYVAAINHDVAILGPELMQLTSTGVYHSVSLPLGTQGMENSPVVAAPVHLGDYIVGMFKDRKGNDAFMVVNRDYKKETVAKVTINLGPGKLLEFSLAEKKWREVKSIQKGAELRLALPPGSGKLFKVEK